MFDRLKEDIQSVKDRDPAATSTIQILLLYPGLKAIRMHRRAYWCWNHNMKFLGRYISQRAAKKDRDRDSSRGKNRQTLFY